MRKVTKRLTSREKTANLQIALLSLTRRKNVV